MICLLIIQSTNVMSKYSPLMPCVVYEPEKNVSSSVMKFVISEGFLTLWSGFYLVESIFYSQTKIFLFLR